MSVKALLIDFGGTLAQVNEQGNKAYEESILFVLKEHKYDATLDLLEEAFGTLYKISSRGEFRNINEFWTALLKEMRMPASDKLIHDLEQVRQHSLPDICRLYEGALQALATLQRKYRLILVSNCAVGMREVIDSLGLKHFFEHYILSYEVGVRKPNRPIYLAALQAVGFRANECLFVADEISDLEGARETGIMTMLVRQGSSTFCEARDPHFKPDLECNRISEITQLL